MCTKRTLQWGDALVLTAMTLVGFLVHGTLDQVFRLFLTAVLVLLAWLGVATSLGLMDLRWMTHSRWWLRIVWAVVLAVPLALTVRGLVLRQAVNPMFPVAMSTFSSLGLLIWRGWFRFRCGKD